MPSPTFAFLIRHPAHFIALGFGAGLAPVMPGTFGTLVAFPIAWWLQGHAGAAGWLVAIVAFTRDRRVGRAGDRDATSAVPTTAASSIDEIVAFLLVLFFVGGDVAAAGRSRSRCSGSSTSSSRRRSASSTPRSRTASA